MSSLKRRGLGPGREQAPYVTQDNTPGRRFKARLPRTKHDSNTNTKRHVSESCWRDLSNDTMLETNALLCCGVIELVKIGPGGA